MSNVTAAGSRIPRCLLCVAALAFTSSVVGGCVPTRSTIGGHDKAELRQWAEQARALCVQATGQAPPSPFTTDGCTLSPDCAWQSCCVEHDMRYWCGGSARARRVADAQLRKCVGENGGRKMATILYWGVRLGGLPWLPTYWRWGYGWRWPHGYVDDKPSMGTEGRQR